MIEKSVAKIIVDLLVEVGVRHVFGIVSIHNMPIVDAISATPGIDLVTSRHEQGAAHMADGYARATGGLGVALGSTGPGTTNMLTGLYEADFASSRLLVITGQAETGFYGKAKGYVHEAENQKRMLEAVTDVVGSPRYAHEVGPMLKGVIEAMYSGRPRPGAIEVPIDLQYASIASPTLTIEVPQPIRPDTQTIEAAVSRIDDADKRVIIAGGGVRTAEARAALTAFAELLNAPVITTANGKGAFPVAHPLHMGNALMRPPIKQLVSEADLVVAIGTRFQAGTGGTKINLRLPALLHIDVDPMHLNLNFKADIAVLSDAELAINALRNFEYTEGCGSYLAKMRALVDETGNNLRKAFGSDHAHALDVFSKYLATGVAFVRDSTIPGYNWGNTLLPIDQPGGYVFPTSGAIGPGLPLGLGVATALAKKTFVMHGDGGLMFHVGELAAAAQYQIPVVVIVFNDGGYGVLRGLQYNQFDGRFNGTELHTPDFVKLAESMGVTAFYANDVTELDERLAAAMVEKGPVLIELNANNMQPIDGVIPSPTA
jgi:acetolactate synthase-1/2/3 large subunit